MKSKKIVYLSQAAMIAALYVVLTLLANALGLANYAIQVRFSEALTILPFFTPAAIPGLTIGCLLSNILTGCAPLDILFGTLATLTGALGTYALRRFEWLAPLPPILANTSFKVLFSLCAVPRGRRHCILPMRLSSLSLPSGYCRGDPEIPERRYEGRGS